jgi:hypothetical protein
VGLNIAHWVLGVVLLLVIPGLRSLRQEDCECQDSLGYIVRPYLKAVREQTKESKL